MSTYALNVQAICEALDQHEANCPFPTDAIEMCGFEKERLGEDAIRGVPVREADMSTGRFRIVCPGTQVPEPQEAIDAVGVEARAFAGLEWAVFPTCRAEWGAEAAVNVSRRGRCEA